MRTSDAWEFKIQRGRSCGGVNKGLRFNIYQLLTVVPTSSKSAGNGMKPKHLSGGYLSLQKCAKQLPSGLLQWFWAMILRAVEVQAGGVLQFPERSRWVSARGTAVYRFAPVVATICSMSRVGFGKVPGRYLQIGTGDKTELAASNVSHAWMEQWKLSLLDLARQRGADCLAFGRWKPSAINQKAAMN